MNKYKENPIHLDRIKTCYDIIVKLYKSLKFKRTSIISNSLILYHKYYIYNLFTNSYAFNKFNESKDFSCISIVCFFISMKTSNYLMKIDSILDICYKNNILGTNIEDEKIKIKNMVLNYESDILFSLNFNVEHELPYNYIKKIWENASTKILECIKNNNINININNNILNSGDDLTKLKIIKEKIADILNYSFLFPFFLYYRSTIIALSCLNIALKNFKIKLNIIDIISNHKEIENISMDDIEVCSSLIDEIILSKIKKVNNEMQTNNINNINLKNIISINHSSDSNDETKKMNNINININLKISNNENSNKNKMFFSKKEK